VKKIYLFIIGLNIFFFHRAYSEQNIYVQDLNESLSGALAEVVSVFQDFLDLLPNLALGFSFLVMLYALKNVLRNLLARKSFSQKSAPILTNLDQIQD